MKNITKSVLVFLMLLTCRCGYAQIDQKLYAKPEDYKLMAKRKLVVELREEDEKKVAKLSKKEKTAQELLEYKNSIVDYNKMIQIAVAKYWKYNTDIEYKTTTEVQALRDAKDNKYVILSYFELDDAWYGTTPEDVKSDVKIPALMYQRAEKSIKMPDYKIYFPSSFVRKDGKYLESDYKLALMGMQANMEWIISNSKSLPFNDYAEKVAEPNCPKLKDFTVLIDSEYLFKGTTESMAKDACSNIEFVTSDVLDTSYINGAKGKAVLFTIPYALFEQKSGTIIYSTLVYFKVIIACETGEILWVHNLGTLAIGENMDAKLCKPEFKKMAECKF